jgi:hypothetical protein
MGRGAEDGLLRSHLDEIAGVHDGDAVGDLRDYGEIVRDEKHGQAEFGAEVGEQGKNLRLDGDIEGGGGFIGDEKLRAVDDGHGDHDALAHAPGKLVRVVAGTTGRASAIATSFMAATPAPRYARLWGTILLCASYGFGDLIPDAHHWIERGHRLLKDHGEARTADVVHVRRLGTLEEVFWRTFRTLSKTSPETCACGGKQAHEGEGSHGFAGAGFAD